LLTQEQSGLREASVEAAQEYGPSYWDDVLNSWADAPALDAWRDYMHRVYQRLLDRWVPVEKRRSGLKTDLFEEAVSSHPVLTEMGPRSIGIDCSTAVVRAAKQRLDENKDALLLAGDLRQLPIRAGSRQYILCGSSLDHFDNFEDIAVCLAELNRALGPGGIAIFTFDNPHNPVVWIRNHLPFRWLQRIGLVPYYVGRTYTKNMVREELLAAGFDILQITAVAHAPRPLSP
jgi:SAM-dependent methyltransferase